MCVCVCVRACRVTFSLLLPELTQTSESLNDSEKQKDK